MQIALKEDLDSMKEKLHSSKTHHHSPLVMVIYDSCTLWTLRTLCCLSRTLPLTRFDVSVTVESTQRTLSSEIPKLNEDLKNKDRKLDDVDNGDRGLSKLWSNLTEMNRKVSGTAVLSHSQITVAD